MQVIDAFAKVSDHMIEGMMMHEQMADYYNFLGLEGFKRLHEYHFLCETISMRRIHRYFIDHCNQLLPVANTKHIDVIPVEWSNFTRQAVELGAVDYDMQVIMPMQHELHEKYRKKLHDVGKKLS